jgi:hypothetical protein
MYQPSAKKMESATEETPAAMPALAPSESWSGLDWTAMGVLEDVAELVVDELTVEVGTIGDGSGTFVACELLMVVVDAGG